MGYAYQPLALPTVPDLHVLRNGTVIGPRLHKTIVVVSFEVVGLKPHTHIHGVKLCREAGVGRVDVIAQVFRDLHDLVW